MNTCTCLAVPIITLTVVSPMELRSSVFISLNWISVGSARTVAYMYMYSMYKKKFIHIIELDEVYYGHLGQYSPERTEQTSSIMYYMASSMSGQDQSNPAL